MSGRVYGYVRVSSRDQNEERQVQALTAFGVDLENIIVDKQSGFDLEREGYASLKKYVLRRGDTLVIKELEYFQEHGIRVKILDVPTTLAEFPEEQMWVMDMINSIMIEVLGSIAEAERLKIRKRQAEGIEAAKQNGLKFGRPKAKKPENWDSVMEKVKRGELRPVDAMKEMGISKSRYYHLCKVLGFKRESNKE